MANEDELAHRRSDLAADEGVGITDVDCTPRPRYRETAEAFAGRMRRMWLEVDGKTRIVAQRNRNAALRTAVGTDGIGLHSTFCACGFRGLVVTDPEIARREYDAHACTIEDGNAIHRKYRGPIDKRPKSTLIPALAEERARMGIVLPGERVDESPVTTSAPTGDDFEQRVKLLETK